MGAEPGFVRANGHDRQINGLPGAQVSEIRRPGRVAAEYDPRSLARKNVTVVAAVRVTTPPRAPMVHFKRANINVPMARMHPRFVAPAQFRDLVKARPSQQIA